MTLSAPYALRRITPDDATALAHFYNALSDATKRLFRPLGLQTDVTVCDAIARANTHEGDRCDLLLLHDNDIVGWCFLWDVRTDKPLFGIGLADDHQGRGLGQIMMSHVMTWARDQSLPSVSLTVVNDNTHAIELYESFGFKVQREFTDDRDGLTYFEMQRRLHEPRP